MGQIPYNNIVGFVWVYDSKSLTSSDFRFYYGAGVTRTYDDLIRSEDVGNVHRNLFRRLHEDLLVNYTKLSQMVSSDFGSPPVLDSKLKLSTTV